MQSGGEAFKDSYSPAAGRYVERCGWKSRCAQVYAHACARVWADDCRLGLCWFAVETLKYEYTRINQVRPSHISTMRAKSNQSVWMMEKFNNPQKCDLGPSPVACLAAPAHRSLNLHVHKLRTMSSGCCAVKYYNIGSKCSSMHDQWLEHGHCGWFYEGASGATWHLQI